MLKPLTDVEATQVQLGALHPFKGLGEPEDIAKVAVFLASDDASWVTGAALPVDGKFFLALIFVVYRVASLPLPRWLHRQVILSAYHVLYNRTRRLENSTDKIDDFTTFFKNRVWLFATLSRSSIV